MTAELDRRAEGCTPADVAHLIAEGLDFGRPDPWLDGRDCWRPGILHPGMHGGSVREVLLGRYPLRGAAFDRAAWVISGRQLRLRRRLSRRWNGRVRARYGLPRRWRG